MTELEIEIALVFSYGERQGWVHWAAIQSDPESPEIIGRTALLPLSLQFELEKLREPVRPATQLPVHEFEVRNRVQRAHKDLVAELETVGWVATGVDNEGRVRLMRRAAGANGQ